MPVLLLKTNDYTSDEPDRRAPLSSIPVTRSTWMHRTGWRRKSPCSVAPPRRAGDAP